MYLQLSDDGAGCQAGALCGAKHRVEMCVTAIANSRAMLLGAPVDLRTWKADLATQVSLLGVGCTLLPIPAPHVPKHVSQALPFCLIYPTAAQAPV